MGNEKSKIDENDKSNKIVKIKNISTDLKKNFSLKENIEKVVSLILSALPDIGS